MKKKKSLTRGVKCKKMRLQKIVGNLIDKLRKLHMNGHPETVVLVNLAENLHCLLLLLNTIILLLLLLLLLLLNCLS